jgi:phenylacetate-CoA ligase
MGPGVAVECLATKDAPHVWEDHFYPEIVDPETGRVLPDGAPGELVFTTLAKEALPVIRYRTRDLTRLLPGTARSMRRMDRITGRSDDMLIIRGVNVFPTQIEELILRDPRLSPHYVIEVKREGRLDALEIVVEGKAGVAGDAAAEADCAAKLAGLVKSLVGVSAAVRCMPAGAIQRSVGKAKRVIDLRPRE